MYCKVAQKEKKIINHPLHESLGKNCYHFDLMQSIGKYGSVTTGLINNIYRGLSHFRS